MLRRKRNVILAAVSSVAVVAGVTLILLPHGGGYAPPRSLPVRAPSATPTAPAAASSGVTPTTYPRSVPTEIIIPAIHVDAHIVPVYDPVATPATCQADGMTPGCHPIDLSPLGQTQNLAGWWAGTPGNPEQSYSPGQLGPAAIVGHVNWSGVGPLVFANLSLLKANDQIIIKLATGQSITFVVSYTQDVYKTAFPTASVYGPTPWPSLRLITCTGTLLSTGHYDHNEIVYATEQ